MRMRNKNVSKVFAAFHRCELGSPLVEMAGSKRLKRVRLTTVLPFTAGVFLGTLITLFLVLTLRSIDDESVDSLSADARVLPSMPRIYKVKDKHLTDISDETTRKELVSYSIVVPRSELKARGLAAHKTWASGLGNRVNFYLSSPVGDEEINFAYKRRMPIIALDSKARSGTSDPLLNSEGAIRTLVDVCKRDVGKYQWHAKIHDTTYVRTKALESILVTLNSSEAHFIGHQVLPEGREREELGLREGEGYCMEMGYVMSARTLQLLCPMLQYCRENARSENEDVEIARCVRLSAGINCTSSREV